MGKCASFEIRESQEQQKDSKNIEPFLQRAQVAVIVDTREPHESRRRTCRQGGHDACRVLTEELTRQCCASTPCGIFLVTVDDVPYGGVPDAAGQRQRLDDGGIGREKQPRRSVRPRGDPDAQEFA